MAHAMAFTSATAALVIVLVTAAAAVAVATLFARSVLAADPGTAAMKEIARAIGTGAHAFLRRQYRTITLLAAGVAGVLFLCHLVGHRTDLAWRTAVAFGVGAASSGTAGYWGMLVSVRANVRVASAARESVEAAMALALRGGAAAALAVVGGSLLGVGALFLLFGGLASPQAVPYQIVGFAFGASFVALFAQLGGGIFTKAADVGADLVGKIESQLPEDDARNPAAIADLVGDNVGDCAGRGADLFESAAAENIGVMILGVGLFHAFGIAGVLFPLVVAALGLVASIAGVLVVHTTGGEDPMSAMTRGYAVTTILSAAGLYAAVRLLLGDDLWLFGAGLVGLLASFAFAWIARYYTSRRFRPVRSIAESSASGSATNVIAGLAVALECTALPVLVIGVALLGSYYCGVRAMPGVVGGGIYGTAIATTGMLATVGYVLSIDMFGPIADNAGGIVEMSGEPEHVRERMDRLDAVGNTTKALTKGYAIGTAALAAFVLLSAYKDEVTLLARARLEALGRADWAAFRFEQVDIGKLPIFVAGLVGGAVVLLFSALAIKAVVRNANRVIEEVRQQLRQCPGILDGSAKPGYGRCVDIITAGALRGMIAPGVLAVATPIVIGTLLERFATPEDVTIGAEAVAAVLMVGTIVGVLLALLMNTGGGAWDNAKKLIETGAFGGKQSTAHTAAVVGDTVGDPLKDTAGPSLHVLIKLLGTVALVAAPLFA